MPISTHAIRFHALVTIEFMLIGIVQLSYRHSYFCSVTRYRAPEICLGGEFYSFPADIFAVGCVMAELYESQPLFPSKSHEREHLERVEHLELLFRFLGYPHPSKWPEGYALARCHYGIDFSTATPYGQIDSMTGTIPVLPRMTGYLRDSPVSHQALPLFRGLVCLNAAHRCSASQALHHAYFSHSVTTRSASPQSVVHRWDPMAHRKPAHAAFHRSGDCAIDGFLS